MPGSAVMNFTDPQEYEAAVRATNIRLVVSAPGTFRAKLTWVDLGRVWAQRAEVSLPTVTYSALTKGRTMIFLQFDPGQAPILNSGVEARPSEIVSYAANSEHHYRTVSKYHCGGMSLKSEDLARFGEILAGREVTAPLMTRIVRPSAQSMSRLLHLHKAASGLAVSAPDVLAHPEVSKAIEQELVRAMVDCMCDPSAPESSRARRLRLQTMRRFEEFLEARKDEPIYIPEICAELGVTDRTLRARCQEHLGMAPHQYLWLRRMNLARRALVRAAPHEPTVTGIANDHGYAALGRFAVAYRKLFGESPSTTLRRV
jgi:AraC-like DNA-binding protein